MKSKLSVTIAGWSMAVLAGLLVAAWIAFVPWASGPGYGFVTSWGMKGSAAGQFNDPTGLAIAGMELFVSDARNERIQVFDLNGTFLRTFGKPGKALGALGRPMNLAVHKAELFVPEYFNDRVQVFSLDGTPKRIIGTKGAGPGQFNAPGGVSVGPDGMIYVADFYNHRIQKLKPDGAFVRQWGEAGSKDKGSGLFSVFSDNKRVAFSYPTDVAVTPNGVLFVADGYNDRVQVFEKDGSFSRRWGGPFAMNISGPFNSWFATVTSVAIGPKGNVFVADFYNHRVQKFAADGRFLTSIGKRGQGPGQFDYPIAVAVSADGTVFVADYGNNRITKWRQDK